MSNAKLQAALKYREMGQSPIPVQSNKKPYIPWREFQERHPEEKEIRRWWKDWPAANVGLVTGKVSGLTVIDIDKPEGREAIEELSPETFVTPTATTPRGGEHRYCQYNPEVPTRTGFIEGCDSRSDGGYIIAPPSKGPNGRPYAWMPHLAIGDVPLAALPKGVAQLALSQERIYKCTNSLYRGDNIASAPGDNIGQHPTTFDNIEFSKGHRDEALFHLANSLVKGGMDPLNIEKYLTFFALHCAPPFPQKEIHAKIQSALKRSQSRERNLTQELREWIVTTSGNFSTTFAYNCQHLTTRDEKKKALVVLGRFVREGFIERVPGQAGVYRRVETECQEIDFHNASIKPFQVRWPLDMEKLARLNSKNIAVIAGEPNSGKTALLLNFVMLNQNQGREILYFSSEMGASELRDRLLKFDLPIDQWNFTALERSSNFADAIKPDAINVIDFLELSDNFYQIGGQLTAIHNKLRDGICVAALQKAPGAEMGRGGAFGMEKPRLYLTLTSDPPDGAVLKIMKAKNRAQPGVNPNYQQRRFKLVNGTKFIPVGNWYVEQK